MSDETAQEVSTLQVEKATAKEFCRITVVFPLRDARCAMELRQEIATRLAADPQAQITFTIASLPGQFLNMVKPEP